MNAENEQEKAAINQELKIFMKHFRQKKKLFFNEELQTFLMKEYKNISDSYGAVN